MSKAVDKVRIAEVQQKKFIEVREGDAIVINDLIKRLEGFQDEPHWFRDGSGHYERVHNNHSFQFACHSIWLNSDC